MDLFEVDPVTDRADVGDRAELLRQRVGEGHDALGLAAHQDHQAVEDAERLQKLAILGEDLRARRQLGEDVHVETQAEQ